MNTDICEVACSSLERFYETYWGLTPIYIELPDAPKGTIDSYLQLDSVGKVGIDQIHADLGYGWGFTIRPTLVELADDLFTLTILGTDLDFETTSAHRLYREAWVRFFVVPNTDRTNRIRAERGERLRALQS
ncbi:UNVERIFIED_ORG: hypothetical protein L601_000100000260 [Gordonia westfalica J30]